jgi:hypothetical protein
MGRKKKLEDDKRQGVYIKLPPWLKSWLKAQGRSQGVVIEKALIKAHKLKEPKKG